MAPLQCTTLSECDFGPHPVVPEFFNLAAHTLAAADKTPNKVALRVVVSGDDQYPEIVTYSDLKTAVMVAAAGLAAHGVTRGDRVVLRIGHSTDFPILFLGAAALGAIPVPTSVSLSQIELQFIVKDTAAVLLICSEQNAIEVSGIRSFAPNKMIADPLQDFAVTQADDLAYIVYTSGSSGRPKGVAHAHRAAFARRMMWEGWYGLTQEDTMLHAGAFNWSYTLGAGLMDPWAAGASSLIYAGPRDPSVWPNLVNTFGATIFAAAPGVYRQLLKSKADLSGFSGLRHGLSAGETMAASLQQEWVSRTGKPVYGALGMTECSTFISSSPAFPSKSAKAGRPQKGRRVALLPIDEGENAVPRGDTGLIAIHRSDPGLMIGYWQNAQETEATMRGEWFLTGDLGVMDSDDYIFFEGRSDDQMNALGYRVAPQEIEDALMRHPKITGAAAVELPIRKDLSVIAAFVTSDELDLTEADLTSHCAEFLASYKVPKVFRTVKELPLNPNGKLKRKSLIKMYGFR
ncbi:class I adenylate-forming enzyme family protein [Falsihalocynthiibacter arcticus]|uniref:class I adenylate-forming enzyme family protein n=1 Tax=Falsihalocynthiibacter arcticus TaxID=1579316 RepID=UPI0030031CEB